MKRFYVIVFFLIAAVACIGLAIAKDSGYVLIAYKSFRYESSLWVTLALLVVLWLMIWSIRLLVGLLTVSTDLVNPWSRRKRSRRIQTAIERGQIDLAEGQWARAKKYLIHAAEAECQPLIHYLGAARAANELGHYKESDNLLERALERQPQAELAVALSHAQLQMERADTGGALTILQAMHKHHPHNAQVLRQLKRLHQQRGDWSALICLLPELRKDRVLPTSELMELELHALGKSLSFAAQRETEGEVGLKFLQRAWQQLTSAQRQEPALVFAYVEQLRQLGAQAEAEQILRGALKCNYDSNLVRIYGLLRGGDLVKQLQTAEDWLRTHSDDPGLLLTLGRLCLQNNLWGKARGYLEDSLEIEPNPGACAELARVLVRLGDTTRSNQLFQEGLSLLDERLLALSLSATTISI